MQWSQLKKYVEDLGLPDHAEVVLEDDAGDTFGVGYIGDDDGQIKISTGDIIEE
jgi:hypothetical protein